MKKSKIISIILGLLIIVTIIIMVSNLGNVAYEHSIHDDWTLGVVGAVQITATLYGILIGILSSILVLINLLGKKN